VVGVAATFEGAVVGAAPFWAGPVVGAGLGASDSAQPIARHAAAHIVASWTMNVRMCVLLFYGL
jgi:hypothetical protein